MEGQAAHRSVVYLFFPILSMLVKRFISDVFLLPEHGSHSLLPGCRVAVRPPDSPPEVGQFIGLFFSPLPHDGSGVTQGGCFTFVRVQFLHPFVRHNCFLLFLSGFFGSLTALGFSFPLRHFFRGCGRCRCLPVEKNGGATENLGRCNSQLI